MAKTKGIPPIGQNSFTRPKIVISFANTMLINFQQIQNQWLNRKGKSQYYINFFQQDLKLVF